jgi:glycine cleavage system H protein
MAAGLISYRLCTRDFDCENCALDAALHGDLSSTFNGTTRMRCTSSWALPEDRLYSTTHTWAHAQPHSIWRIGIDAFAAALIGNVSAVGYDLSHQLHTRGALLCTVDVGLGILSIGAPIPGRVVEWNDALQRDPALLVTRPYDEGWLAEVAAPQNVVAGDLMPAAAARHQVALDLRRFRRSIAIRLFAEATTTDPHVSEPERLSDLRNVIAGDGYLELLREFIH